MSSDALEDLRRSLVLLRADAGSLAGRLDTITQRLDAAIDHTDDALADRAGLADELADAVVIADAVEAERDKALRRLRMYHT